MFITFFLLVPSVPCWVHDATRGQAAQLHPRDTQRPAASPAEGAAVHSSGDGARVTLLQQLRDCTGLPVALPLHRHRVQLLLLHLPRPRRQPGNVRTWRAHTPPACTPNLLRLHVCQESLLLAVPSFLPSLFLMEQAHGELCVLFRAQSRQHCKFRYISIFFHQHYCSCIATAGAMNTTFQRAYVCYKVKEKKSGGFTLFILSRKWQISLEGNFRISNCSSSDSTQVSSPVRVFDSFIPTLYNAFLYG